MPRVRVLVVDGAAVMRRTIAEALATDPAIEVVGTASNGRIALGKIEKLEPDLVTLDLEMPGMEHLELMSEIQRVDPRVRVLVLSACTDATKAHGFDALARAGIACVPKPKPLGNRADAMRWVAKEIGSRVRALRASGAGPPAQPTFQGVASVDPAGADGGPPAETVRRPGRIELIVIGASTGGPDALATVIPQLGADLTVPVLIVQHMPPVFTRSLAARLGSRSGLRVAEAVAGVAIRPGEVWIAPGDHHILVERRGGGVCLALNQDPPENACRPAADVLFRSAARVYGSATLAVVLTGMGRDGMLGCDAIRRQGGYVIVQDSATSVVWGMPGAIARAGLADQMLPLGDIGNAVALAVSLGRRRRRGPAEEDAA